MNLKTDVSKATVNPLVSARDKHAIDVEPIVPRRNNMNVHLDYLRHLKESVETIRDIVEEAKIVRPLDRSIVSACRYTKHSQELLEYTIGTCPHGSQLRAKQLAHIPLIRKKQEWTVTPIASESQPMSHVKPNRISLAKDFVCQTCAKCVTPSTHDLCVATCLQSAMATPSIHYNHSVERKTPTMDPPVRADDQILPHIRANIDYAKRIWEEFTQSIHTFIEDKRNLSRHISGKKRATLIVIPSIRFTKLIIHHLQRKHRFHPRPDSPLHLSNEEPVLGYIKFSAKGTKREIFGMPIPGRLITANIREAPYYQEYQENMAKHRGFLAGETRSTQDLPAPKPAKPARKPQGSPKYVGDAEAEEVPAEEPQVADEDADFQKAVEESMKDAYALPKGSLTPVVIREPESGKYQPLPEVPGKGKAKVSEEQVAHDLLSLQKHKKTSHADQYIFQSEKESEKIVLGVEKGSQDEDPGNAEARVKSTSSPVVHAGSDREHMDIDVANVSPQPSMEQLYEGFTATVYPNVQENLKLAVEEPVLLEEPASSSGTLSSLQHLSRDFTFGDQFFSDKPSDAEKSIETKVESMEHQQLKATTTNTTTTTTTTTLPPPQAPQQNMTEAMMVKRIGELEHTLADLIQVNKTMEERDLPEADMKEILHQRMWETDSYKSHEDHMQLFEALEKLINRDQSEELAHDLAEARKKRKKDRELPKTPHGSPSHQPPPPPPPAGPSGTSGAPRASGSQVTPPPTSTNQDSPSTGSAAPSLTKTAATTKHQTWSTPDVTLKPLVSLTPEDLDMDEAMEERPTTPEPAWSIRTSDVPVPPNNWASTMASNYSLPPEDSLLVQIGDITTFMDCVDDPILRHNISKLLPLGGPPGHVIIQSDFFFNKDLEYLRYDSKGRRPALSISKMKAAYYPEAGLEQMVPNQFWIEEEYKYDIAAIDGTLQQIVVALDYRVKEFRINRMNPGLNTRFWTRKDIDRCNAFMFAIQRRLRTRRIFHNLESFVGRRVREGDYRLLKHAD
nr:histone deacetylase 14 [Tanacetum cinerariifolium]